MAIVGWSRQRSAQRMTDKLKSRRFVRSIKPTGHNMSGCDDNKTAGPRVLDQIKERLNNRNVPAVRRKLAADSRNSTTASGAPAQPTTSSRRCQTAKPTARGQRQRARRRPPGAMNNRETFDTLTGQLKLAVANSEHVCFGCKQPIKDRYLLSACDKYWHNECLKCDRCQAKLGELGSTLYERANMNLCRQDYFEMFGQKAICAVCDKLIYASEMVMRARDNVYHLECFACQLCGLRFCIGDRFHLCENKIVCQYDYDEHIYPMQGSMFDYQNAPMLSTSAPQVPPTSRAPGSFLHPGPPTTSPPDFVSTLESGQLANQSVCPNTTSFEIDCNQKATGPREGGCATQTHEEYQRQHQGPAEEIELTVLGCGPARPLEQRDSGNSRPAEAVDRERGGDDDERVQRPCAEVEPCDDNRIESKSQEMGSSVGGTEF